MCPAKPKADALWELLGLQNKEKGKALSFLSTIFRYSSGR
jgi:hypothetical protein